MLFWSHWNSWIVNISQLVLGKSMLLVVTVMQYLPFRCVCSQSFFMIQYTNA